MRQEYRTLKRTPLIAALGGCALAILGIVSGSTEPLSAASSSTNLAVSATVSQNCTITTSPVAFGSYDPIGTNATTDLDGTGSLDVACTKGVAPTIGLDTGSNASGSQRRLLQSGGVDVMDYDLYQDSGRATPWGTGANQVTATAATSKAARTFTVYGRVTANQDVSAGSYADTVVASVNF